MRVSQRKFFCKRRSGKQRQGDLLWRKKALQFPPGVSLKNRAADEIKRFIVIFLYLWVVFALLSLHTSFVLSQHHLDYQEHTFAIINAFIFAKVLLIGEHFQFGTRFKDKALIYPILHKSFIFTVVGIGFHIVETALVGLWHGNSITDSLVGHTSLS